MSQPALASSVRKGGGQWMVDSPGLSRADRRVRKQYSMRELHRPCRVAPITQSDDLAEVIPL